MGALTGLCVLLAVLTVALSEDKVTPVFFTDGGNLTLEVRPAFPEHITIILWKFNGNLLAEWVENVVPLRYYSTFKDRSTLATDTGLLIISNMKKADEGVYSVGVNSKVQSESYEAILIKKVPKPTVRIRTLTCSPVSESCNVTCEADTNGAEPVTYSWKRADGEWQVSGKDITITKIHDAHMKTLTCRIQNPVSAEVSDDEPNKLYRKQKPNVGPIAGGVTAGLVILGGGAGLFAAWKKKKFCFKNRGITTTDSPPENHQPAEDVPLKNDSKSDTTETA